MSNRHDLILREANDETVHVTITKNVPVAGTVFDLTGSTLEAYLKPSASTADGDASVWQGTSGGGQIVVTSAAAGQATIHIPAAATTTTKTWWRLDVITAGKRKTAAFGSCGVVNV